MGLLRGTIFVYLVAAKQKDPCSYPRAFAFGVRVGQVGVSGRVVLSTEVQRLTVSALEHCVPQQNNVFTPASL